MMLRRTITFCLLAVLSVVAGGCKKKPAKVIPPPPSLPEPSAFLRPLPAMIVGLMRVPVYPPEPTVAEAPTEAAKKPKPPRRRPRPSPPAQTPPPSPGETAQSNPPRITIDRPQAGEGSSSIAPVLEHSDEAHRRQTTAQLLHSTEESLRGITRNLSEEEHALVAQIRNFIAQSRLATNENDVVRAHNLALKAHLLSDELARH
jgi:hypothetical protein